MEGEEEEEIVEEPDEVDADTGETNIDEDEDTPETSDTDADSPENADEALNIIEPIEVLNITEPADIVLNTTKKFGYNNTNDYYYV